MSESRTYDPYRSLFLVRGVDRPPSYSEGAGATGARGEGFTLMRASSLLTYAPARATAPLWRAPSEEQRVLGYYVGGDSPVAGEVLGIVEFDGKARAAAALHAVAKGRYDQSRGVDVREGVSLEEVLSDWAGLAAQRGAEVVFQADALVERERVGIAEAVSVSVSDLRQAELRDPTQFTFRGVAEGHDLLLTSKNPDHGRMLASYAALDGHAELTAELVRTSTGPVRLDVLSVEPRMAQLMVSRDEAVYALANDADAAKFRAKGEVTPTAEALRHLAGAVSQPVFKRDKHGVMRESGRMVGREALQKSFAWQSKALFRSVSVDLSLVSGHLRQMIRPLADRTRSSLTMAVKDSKGRTVTSIAQARQAPVQSKDGSLSL